MARVFKSKISVCVAPANPPLQTSLLFDATHSEPKGSSIDEFLNRLKAINKLAPSPTNFDPLQGQLVLLGIIGAVESYLRSIFRKLITIDVICQNAVHRSDVSFGAALHLSKEMLPEAILERISFISRTNIEDAMRDLLSIKGVLPSDLDTALKDYVRVCQLRHCAVHRFGKLGTSNAIALGMSDHKALLEKPLRLDYASLQCSIAIATGLVKTINNFLFNESISRIPDGNWSGVYKTDKNIFQVYYEIFADTVSSTGAAVDSKSLYALFMDQRAKFARNEQF